ncbi:MAG: DNA-packaging protein, partial [Porphyrobacter sp.]|nr:DNA-packaging protein [Porphyrobacter sp.]
MSPSSLAEELLQLDRAERVARLKAMSHRQRLRLLPYWRLWAHEGQLAPEGDWHTWIIMAGRGYGKTRAGAEWVRSIAEKNPTARIALVGDSLGEVRRVMVEGPSGLLALGRPKLRPVFEPSKRQLTWANGAVATLYSAGEPESLRGPQHSHAWCDEIAKWSQSHGRAESTWDNLLLGLRLGDAPRLVATTTPRAAPLLRRLLKQPNVAVTRGKTEDNRDNLATGFYSSVKVRFGRSLLARQELDGELIEEIDG